MEKCTDKSPIDDDWKRTIEFLPDNCLEHIFTHVNLYEDFNSVLLVSKRWNRLALDTLRRMKRLFRECTDFSWRFIESDSLLSERCSHSVCYHPNEYVIYMFGGCNNTYTAFNDLWLFDLNTHEWERVLITRHPMPSPKALATMVLYNDNLLLFGGFSKSSMNPIHQTSTFFNELHLYDSKKNCWEEIVSENTAPHLAGHTASIVGNFMLVFGGSMGSSYNNNVYVLDLLRRIWNMPTIPGPCPPPRYGQSQILLDNNHLIIIGGCGGPNMNFSDVWLLDFDLCGDSEWKWTQLKVENQELTPPYMWCHRACKVGTNAVVVSRPIKSTCAMRGSEPEKGGIHRRRTSSQSTTSSAGGGSGRLTSPDSPSDKRAVAAAFCASSAEQLHQQVQRKRGNSHRDKKPILLTSRSLDDQEHRQANGIPPSSSFADLQDNANPQTSNAHNPRYLNTPSTRGYNELQRACSIPTIIVGEIPKLIVTSTTEPSTCSQRVPTPNQRSVKSDICLNKSSSHPKKMEIDENEKNNSALDSSDNSSKQEISEHETAVRNYYISLVKDEHNRLCIVEPSENLGNMTSRLEEFLSNCIPYLTKQERLDIVEEFLANNEENKKEESSSNQSKGSIRDLQNRSRALSGDNPSPSSKNANSSAHCSTSFGPFYGRQMCVYVLRLQNILTEQKARWEQLPIEVDAPEDRLLHSLISGRGELILFGGMNSDGIGMDCLNVGMERYTMSAETYILRPRYNEM
uniref:F-box domain-containing protein n=1 Tax=Meloidogyne incognita TaxID=6306 RepID=A0A914L7D5_MELIC